LENYEKGKNNRQFPILYLKMADAFTKKGDIARCFYYNRNTLLVRDSLHMIRKINFHIYFNVWLIYMGLHDF
jgi:hypothetical protein